MNQEAVHLALFVISAVVSAGLIAWARRHNSKRAATLFIIHSTFLLLWNIAVIGKILLPLGLNVPAHFASQACKITISITWFVFTFSYVGYDDILNQFRTKAFVACSAVIMYGLQVYTTFHAPRKTIREPFTIVVWQRISPHYVIEGLAFLLIGLGTFVLVHRLVTAGYTRTWQTSIIGVTLLANIVFEGVENTIVATVPGIEYSAVVTSFSAVIYIIVLYRYDLFGHRPVAKADVINVIEDPVIVLNPARKVIDHNDEAEFLLDDDPVGKDATEVINDKIASLSLISELEEGYQQVTINHENGERHYDIQTAALDSMANENGVAVILRDITELEEYTRKLERQTEQLDEFASIVSHDLRNPLAVIDKSTKMLATDVEKDEIEDIQNAVDRMEEIISDSLTLARQGQVVEDVDDVRFDDIVDEAWATSSTDTATLDHNIPDNTVLKADTGRIHTLLENIFRNSIDHGPDDVTIRIGITDDKNGFYIEDTGPGIPADNREKVFEKGYSSDEDGTGFGLAIVDSIVKAHGWGITVGESSEGGARFEITDVTLSLD